MELHNVLGERHVGLLQRRALGAQLEQGDLLRCRESPDLIRRKPDHVETAVPVLGDVAVVTAQDTGKLDSLRGTNMYSVNPGIGDELGHRLIAHESTPTDD